MYPAFATGTHRYGVTTTADTAGTVTVTASTSDAAGSVWVDGQPAVGGTATLTGLTSGDEISVFIKDSAGTSVYSLIYLPPGFPTLTVVTKTAGIAPGDVFLTPSDFTGNTPSFETAVDNNGVPVYVRTDTGVPLDFKRQPNGDYSVARQPPPVGRTGDQIVELNSRYEQIAAYETVNGLTDTDGHDSILLPNGDRWLIASQPNSVTNKFDAVIQEQDPDGKVRFQWSTAHHVDVALDSVLPNNPDYAHINSIWVMQNGDILASFRHLDQVMEIATHKHDGFKKGDVVWSLGGRRPTLTVANDPDDGPCAQHSASELPNGHILIFDDGSESISGSAVLCVDPANPTGSTTIARPQSRVTEYSINQNRHTATLVWSYQVAGREVNFEGSAQRLPNGNTIVGWGPNTAALATEVNSAKQTVWELKDDVGLFSYRALRFPAPDAIKPVVDVTQPAQGATYTYGQQVVSDFSCTDRGGSSLQSCSGPVTEGAAIDTTTSGSHTFTVVGKDGAGNTTTVTRTYHVVSSPYRPDALIKRLPGGAYVGGRIEGGISAQQVKESIARSGKSASARARFENVGSLGDRIEIVGTAGTKKFRVAYFAGNVNVTKKVTAGTYKTPSLAPGKSFVLLVKVTRTTLAKVGNSKTVKLSATSVHDAARHDAVATIVRAVR